MRARDVILALLIIAIGLAITAHRRGAFNDWTRPVRDISEIVDAATGSMIGGDWRAVEQFSRKAAADAARSVLIENPNGQVSVVGRAQDFVQVDAVRFGRGVSEDEVARNAKSVRLDLSRVGDQVTVRVVAERHLWNVARLNLSISVPRGSEVEVKSASGDVDVRDIEAGVDVTTASGDVVVGRANRAKANTASGDISITETRSAEANTASGDVKLQGIRGPAKCRAVSGDVTLEHVNGEVQISTVSSDVSARSIDESFSATTVSGSIELQEYYGADTSIRSTSGDVEAFLLTPLTGTFTARTISGDITVAIPSNSDCTVDMSSTSGDIDTQLELHNTMQSRRQLTGVLGRGQGRLQLHSVSGSLTVDERPAQAPPAAVVKPGLPSRVPPTPPTPPTSPRPASPSEWAPVVQ